MNSITARFKMTLKGRLKVTDRDSIYEKNY